MDFDNDHSDDPKDWITVEDIKKRFPGVRFGVHYSRNHMKEKERTNGGNPIVESARPRFHSFFPVSMITDAEEYAELKKALEKKFPFVDTGALDAARFFFGTEDPQVEIIEGKENIDDFFDLEFMEVPAEINEIKAGERHDMLLHFANKFFYRYGETPKAQELFELTCERCNPPHDPKDIERIWKDAKKYYKSVVLKLSGYIPPEVYNGELDYQPEDESDDDQALMLKKVFGEYIKFTDSTDFLIFDRNKWRADKYAVQALGIKLAEYQYKNALAKVEKARAAMNTDAIKLIDEKSPTVAKNHMPDTQRDFYEQYKRAVKYKNYASKMKNINSVNNTLDALKPITKIDIKGLDDPDEVENLLNTPAGTYDLHKGMDGMKNHDPADLITKITAVSPGDEGDEIWKDFLETIFCEDQELIEYAQEVCGLAAYGKIHYEALIIAYGDGANGKSTFWNTVAKVLGDYSGRMSAETLTNSAKHNVKAEMASLRGQRMTIAAELGYRQYLNDSIVKQLCSTDDIFADPKYKAPFQFTPQHTLILYTNNLPRVAANDYGIWRRLKVIPFKATITGSDDKKNYGDFLYKSAGPAILKWIIEGAKRIFEKGFKLEEPASVLEATKAYQRENDWLSNFIEDCCDVGSGYEARLKDLYEAFEKYQTMINEKPKPRRDFIKVMDKAFEKAQVKGNKKYSPGYKGLRLKPEQPTPQEEFEEEEEDYGF